MKRGVVPAHDPARRCLYHGALKGTPGWKQALAEWEKENRPGGEAKVRDNPVPESP